MADINENGNLAESEAFLEVKNLNKYFTVDTNFFGKPTKFLKAVDGVSFSLQKGKTLGIVGESGCGKTTLGRTILRLYDITSGEVNFKGKKVSDLKDREFNKLRPNMQMIFQDPYASLSPRLTVGEIIGEAARQHKIVDKAHYRDYIMEVMKMCGLQPHYFERYPHEFSGGQRQRICIARALALKPELVICDEPVSALDVSIQAQIINMLIELRKTLGLTYVFISHDLSVVKHISDEVGVMYLGSMVEYGSKKDIFENTLHPYTKALFSAVPVPNPHVKMNRIILKGDIPSPVNPPKGCKFHTRCESCMEICERIKPNYKEIEPGHFCACHLYNTEEEIKHLEEQYEKEQKELAEKQAKQAKWKFWEKKKNNGNKEEKTAEETPVITEATPVIENSVMAEEAPVVTEAIPVVENSVAAEEAPVVTEAIPVVENSVMAEKAPVVTEVPPVAQISEETEEEVVADIYAVTTTDLTDVPTVTKETEGLNEVETENTVEPVEEVKEEPVVKKPEVKKTTTAKKTISTAKKPSSGTAAKKTTSSTTAKKPASTTTAKKTTSTAKKPSSGTAAKKTTSSTTAKKTASGTAKKSTSTTARKTTSSGAKKPTSTAAKKTASTATKKTVSNEVNNVPKE